jgi:hypothetical protein
MTADRRRWTRPALLALAVALVLLVALAGSQPSDPPVVQLFDSPTYAVQAFLYWDEAARRRDLQLIREMGFTHVKTQLPWREIETYAAGDRDWYRADALVRDVEEAGLSLIARLDRQPFWSQANGGWPPLDSAPPAENSTFEGFCEAVAARYRGRIEAYQVWNEPNLAREWGDNWGTEEIERSPNAREYVALLRACYQGIKRGDPAALVISAGLAPTGTQLPDAIPDAIFLQQMYDAGASPYFDVLGIHAPGYGQPPELSPGDPAFEGYRWRAFRHVEEMRQIMVLSGDAHKQIAVLEVGWTTDTVHPDYSWMAVNEEQQADYLVRAYGYAQAHWQPWIGPLTVIYIASPFWTEENEEWWWALTLPGFPEASLRPAYHALAAMPKPTLPRHAAPDTTPWQSAVSSCRSMSR